MRGYYSVQNAPIKKTALKQEKSNFMNSFEQEFKDNLNKLSTKRRESNVSSLQHLLGQKPFASEVIKQMQEKLGLKDYFAKLSAEQMINQIAGNNVKQKEAQIVETSELPIIFQKLSTQNQDKLKHFIENRIKTHHGYISIPALQHEILSNFKSEGISQQDIDELDLQQYLSKMILSEMQNYTKPNNNSSIGLEDQNSEGVTEDFMMGMTE